MRSFSLPASLMCVLLDQLDDAHRVDRRLGLEGDVDHAGRGVDLDHAVGLAQHAQAVHVDQGLAWAAACRSGRRSLRAGRRSARAAAVASFL
jgi:hypothetical protein